MKRIVSTLCALLMLLMHFSAAHADSAPEFASMADAAQYIRAQEALRMEVFSFELTDPQALRMDSDALTMLLLEVGPSVSMGEFRLRRKADDCMEITFYPTYRAGVRMVDAWRSGDESALSSSERKTLEQAQRTVRRIRQEYGGDLAVERAIHDFLCREVRYASTRPDVSEPPEVTAVGALQNGRANCQGYADAFYLLASLAGFEVDYQSGTQLSSGDAHLWNVIRLGGQWYVVDVSSDDLDGDAISDDLGSYILFNAGQDLCRGLLTHPETYKTHAIAARSDEHYFYFSEGHAFSSLDAFAQDCVRHRSNSNRLFQAMVYNAAGDCEGEALNNAVLRALRGDSSSGGTRWSYRYWNGLNGHLYLYFRWDCV